MELLLFLVIVILVIIFTNLPEHVPSYKFCENQVSASLHTLDPRYYRVYDNIVLPLRGSNTYTEIDHLVISPYGIFCIETKSHKGQIYGSNSNDYWYQYLGNNKYEFYSPMKQNLTHAKAVADYLGIDISHVSRYVTFPNAAKTVVNGSASDLGISEVLNNINAQTTPLFRQEECEYFINSLNIYSRHSEQLQKLHIARLQAKKYV